MGALGVSLERFIWRDIAIVAITSALFTALGYFSGRGYGFLERAVGYGPWRLAGMFVLFLASAWLYNRLARRCRRQLRQPAGDETAGRR